MKQSLLLFFTILTCTTILAQIPSEKPKSSDKITNNRLLQYNMDMPVGVNSEQFVHGIADFPISKDLAVRLERFYTKFGNQEQLKGGFAFKYFLNKKSYLITGLENQYIINGSTGAPKKELTRLNLGIGHNVKPNLLIELGYKPMIGSPNPAVSETIISNRGGSFSFKTRF